MQIVSYIYDNKTKRFLALFLISFIWSYFFQYSITPLIYFDGTDSIVYKQMGLALIQGKLLYIEIFDHKGPFLYFINSIGELLGMSRWGLFLLHVFNYSVVAFIWTEITDCFGKSVKNIYPVFLGIVIYLYLNCGGNLTEDWCMIPISYALYLGVKTSLRTDKQYSTSFSLITLGVFSAVVFFIRANNAATILCTFFYIIYVERNRWVRILLNVSIGFCLLTTPILLYFFIVGGWDYVYNMIYGSIIFNIGYAAKAHEDITLYQSSFFIHYCILAFILLILCLFRKHVTKKLLLYLVASFLFSILVMGKNNYSHYLIILIPLYIPLFQIALENRKHLEYIAALICIMIVMRIPIGTVHSIFVNRNGYEKFYQLTDDVIKRIPQEERINIWNYNTAAIGPSILNRHGIVQCNKIFHLFQTRYSDVLKNERENELINKFPDWIIINEHSNVNKKDSAFIYKYYKKEAEIDFVNHKIKAIFYKKTDA